MHATSPTARSNELCGMAAAPVTGACTPILIVVAVTPVVSPPPLGAVGAPGAVDVVATGGPGSVVLDTLPPDHPQTDTNDGDGWKDEDLK